jgi:formate/nitrite transporter FocA (FNT family)
MLQADDMDKRPEPGRRDKKEAVRVNGEQGQGFALSKSEEKEVEHKLPTSVQVLHEAIRIQGEQEMSRTTAALAWSSLAAGLSMGFSMLVPALLHAHLSESPERFLLSRLGYAVGFLVVILARQQLFTENTMTAVLPFMTKPGSRTLMRLLRLWGIVFLGNFAGGALFALGAVHAQVIDAPTHDALLSAGAELMQNTTLQMFTKAIVAGWLIATMVWLATAAENAKTLVIVLLTYLVGIGGFAHIVVGSIEGMFLVFEGRLPFATFLSAFVLPVLAGNIVGGSLIFALISHAQVRSDDA